GFFLNALKNFAKTAGKRLKSLLNHASCKLSGQC
uniref:Cyanophlyctin-beta n=2 Tax=Euphlyctis cyanophlyctis TaxID=58519 RepID=CYPB_EUPCP|nr:RecName: Full=Cyanophlyctin-beta [Euphlyctis cyanophlyctis]